MRSTITAELITSANYMIIKLNENFITEKIKNSFSKLSIDKYMKDGDNYRFRAFLQGVFKGDKITWFEKTDFFQSKNM